MDGPAAGRTKAVAPRTLLPSAKRAKRRCMVIRLWVYEVGRRMRQGRRSKKPVPGRALGMKKRVATLNYRRRGAACVFMRCKKGWG